MVQRFILWWKWHFGDLCRKKWDEQDGRLLAHDKHIAAILERLGALKVPSPIPIAALADLQKQLDQLRANVAAHDEERKQVIRAKTWREFQTLTNEESLENVPAR
jgi:hypothetical protein